MTLPDSCFSPRVRSFLQGCARLALFVMIFQIMAIDHWHGSAVDLMNVPGVAQHAAHCHGGGGGCANDAGLSGPLSPASLAVIQPPPPLADAIAEPTLAPAEAFRTSLHQPPRVA